MERTLAAAEQDEARSSGEACCTCGSEELLLTAYLRVVGGRPTHELVEVEALTCPQCGREYEPVRTEDGRVLPGDLLGTVELDEE